MKVSAPPEPLESSFAVTHAMIINVVSRPGSCWAAMEQLLTDNDDKLSDDVKTEVRSAVDDLKKALEGDDLAEVTAKQTALVTASQKIGEALYSANQQPEGAPAGEQPAADAPSAQDDDVVDAEIVDDEGDKK